MKKILFVLLLLTLYGVVVFSQTEDSFYYYRKDKINIPINEKFIVVYSESQQFGDALIDTKDIKDVSMAFGVNDENAKEFEIRNNANYGEVTSNLRRNSNVKSVEPVIGDSMMCSNRFFVKLTKTPCSF